MRPIDCVWFKAGIPHPVARTHSLRLYGRDVQIARSGDGLELKGEKGTSIWVPMTNVAALELGPEKQPELPSNAKKGGRA